MRTLRTAFVAGVAALAATGVAVAASEHVHVMEVSLPDGGVAQIHYIGDAKPSVAMVQAPVDAQRNFLPVGLDDDPFFAPFAQMDLMMAQMEARHQAMMQQIANRDQMAAADADGAPVQLVSQGDLPAGTVVQYSFHSSTSGANGCTQTVEWRSDGSGKEPKVVRASSGDCDAAKPSAKPQPTASTPEPAAPEQKAKPAVQGDQTQLLQVLST